MIRHGAYDVAPWEVRERTLDLEVLAQSESCFALSNGHIGLRGNLDEGEPFGLPGTYLNGFYETIPLPYAEAGYGYPESGQSVVNATNGKIIRLLVADEPFDLRYGRLGSHERTLDLRAGTLTREVEWTSPTEDTVKLHTTRLVSFAQRAIAAIEYIVEPVDKPLRVVLQSELVANEPMPRDERGALDVELDQLPRPDPRSAMLQGALESERHGTHDLRAILVHRTKAQRAADGRGLRPRGRVRARPADGLPVRARLRAHDLLGPDRARLAAAARQVHRLRLVGAAVHARAPRPGLGGPRRGQAHRLGRPRAAAARVPRRVLGARRRRDRRRATAAAGAALRDVPRRSSPARATRAARSRPRASPAPGTTGTRSGTPRPSFSRC